MRGSPCALMVRHNAENLIGHPASLAGPESLNRQSWCSSRPNTWLMEPERLPSKMIEIQRASLGRFANANRSFN